MKTFTKTRCVLALVAATLGAPTAHAGGFLADLGQTLGVISPGQARALDDWHRQVKERNPGYRALEESTSSAVRNGTRAAGAYYLGPGAVVAGDVLARQHRARLEQQRRQAMAFSPRYQSPQFAPPSVGIGRGHVPRASGFPQRQYRDGRVARHHAYRYGRMARAR